MQPEAWFLHCRRKYQKDFWATQAGGIPPKWRGADAERQCRGGRGGVYAWVRENFVNFSTGTPNPCLGVIYKLYNPSKVCELPSKPLVFAVRHGAMGGHGGVFEGCSIRCGVDTIM